MGTCCGRPCPGTVPARAARRPTAAKTAANWGRLVDERPAFPFHLVEGDEIPRRSWTRGHGRLGGTVLKPEALDGDRGNGRRARGVDGHGVPECGDYSLPAGLAPLAVDRDADRGSDWEPNVWMRHAVVAEPVRRPR
jgi:hypothetical protein